METLPEYEEEFGPLTGEDAKSHLQKKMGSAEPSELNVPKKTGRGKHS